MTAIKTQIGGAAAAAGASSASGSNSAGVDSTQPSNGQQVENPNGEANGNSGNSDNSNGSNSNEGTRQRPNRAERRIGQLTAKLHQQGDATAESDNLRTMLENPLKGSDVTLPDRSEQGEITPEQYKEDLINAADQIVKIRLQSALSANNRQLSKSQLATRAIDEIEASPSKYNELNPDHEEFDPDLEQYLAETFERSFKADPNYRFEDLVKSTMKLRKGSSSNQKATDKDADGRSNGAIKGGSVAAKSTKSIEDMSSEEYKAHLKSSRR